VDLLQPGSSTRSLFLAVFLLLASCSTNYAENNAASEATRGTPGVTSAIEADPLYRHFDACAHVTVFGLTVFSRCGVGGGFAFVKSRQADHAVILQFVSGSSPERAHGLNRMGLIQEVVREQGAQPVEFSYFGFITANNEESVVQARKALDDSNRTREVPYTWAQGTAAGSSMHYQVNRLQLPASYRWSDSPRMLDDIQQRLKTQNIQQLTLQATGNEQLRTFLYAMRTALLSRETKTEQTVIHNGTLFQLTLNRTSDPKAGVEFLKAGLITQESQAMRLTGVIKNAKTGFETPFSVWFDGSSRNIIPLRFEFRPRSYLKLAFQADQQSVPAKSDLTPDIRAGLR
jgi:hypothetical protein